MGWQEMTELHDYQEELVGGGRNRILIGGRQIGKTTTCVEDAVRDFRNGRNVAGIAPMHRQARELVDHIVSVLEERDVRFRHTRTKITQTNGNGCIEILPSTVVDGMKEWNVFSDPFSFDLRRDRGRVIIDEANYVDQEILFIAERCDAPVLLTATPAPEKTVVEIWAEHSPYWETTQVSGYGAPHLNDKYLKDFDDSLTNEQSLREVDGAIL